MWGYVGGQLTNVSGTLYFSADDGRHGQELWRSDGTVRGTRMVKDINPGPRSGYFSGITPVGRTLYFSADDGVHGVELWRSDGTRAGTRMVKDLNPGSAFYNGVGWLTGVSGTLYFGVTKAPYPSAIGLWRSDGTEAGTTLVKTIHSFGSPADVNGTLYFAGAGGRRTSTPGSGEATAPRRGRPLSTNPTSASSAISPTSTAPSTSAPALAPVAASCGEATAPRWGRPWSRTSAPEPPGDLTDVNGILYFVAPDGRPQRAVAKRRHRGGDDRGHGPRGASDLTAVKGIIYFSAGGALWRSNGTPQGTTLVKGSPATPRH